MNGSSPIVTERGPYTFLQKIRKEIIGFENSKQLISYKDFKTYHFLREKSVGGLDDEITVVNIPVVVRSLFGHFPVTLSDKFWSHFDTFDTSWGHFWSIWYQIRSHFDTKFDQTLIHLILTKGTFVTGRDRWRSEGVGDKWPRRRDHWLGFGYH